MLSGWSVRSQWNRWLHSTIHTFAVQDGMVCSCFCDVWDGYFGCFDKGTAEVLICLLNIGGARRCQALHGFVGEEAVVIPVGLTEVPSLHWLTR